MSVKLNVREVPAPMVIGVLKLPDALPETLAETSCSKTTCCARLRVELKT